MRQMVTGEVQKLFSTRLWLWLLLASSALTILYATLTIAFADTPDTFTLPLSTAEGQRTLLAVGAAAAPFAAILGAVSLTGEYRHRTATATFLATPQRARVVVAKLVTYTLAGAGYSLVGSAVAALVAVPWLAGKDIDLAVTGPDLVATLLGVTAAVALFGMIGVALGAVLQDQVATVVVLLVYLFVIENILTNVPALDRWTPYLPGQAEEALVGSTLPDRLLLEPWQGGLLLAGYAIALAWAGTALAVRRDLT